MKKNTSECYQALRANLSFDARRVELMACLLIAIIQQNTSNLARLANVLDLSGKVRAASKYKRLQRFCREAKLDYDKIAKLIMAILKSEKKYVLALDRTEWRYGKVWVNILTLSIVVGKTSIPLYWQTLNRKGNSTLGEREKLINRYLQTFGVEQLKYLTADREFDWYQFMKYLKDKKVNFRMRVRVRDGGQKGNREENQIQADTAEYGGWRTIQDSEGEKIRLREKSLLRWRKELTTKVM